MVKLVGGGSVIREPTPSSFFLLTNKCIGFNCIYLISSLIIVASDRNFTKKKSFPWVFYRFCYCILGDDLNKKHVVSENHEMPVIFRDDTACLHAYVLAQLHEMTCVTWGTVHECYVLWCYMMAVFVSSTVQCRAAQYSMVQYITIQCIIIHYHECNTAHFSTLQYITLQLYAIQYSAI